MREKFGGSGIFTYFCIKIGRHIALPPHKNTNKKRIMQTVCHLAMLPYEQAKKYSTKTVFEYQDFGSKVWKSASWTDFA